GRALGGRQVPYLSGPEIDCFPLIRNARQQLNTIPTGSIRGKALRFQPAVNIAGAKETALAYGHVLVDMYAMVVLGLLRRDDRVARGAYAVFQGLAVGTRREIANIRQVVCHGFRAGT